MPELRLSRPKVDQLQKEIVPFLSEWEMRLSGTSIIANPDPVLRFLANKDESAYRIMERNHPKEIYAPRQNRDNKLLSAGSEIVLGESKSNGARFLHAFMVAAMKRIERWPQVQALIQDAVYWGWRPMELVWDTAFRHKRTEYWVVSRIVDKLPENFRFTVDRNLVYVDPRTGNHLIFDDENADLKWLTPTFGSIDNPYGDAIYKRVWIPAFAKSRFFEAFAQGMQRSTGTLKVRHGFNRPAGDAEVASITDSRDPDDVMNSVVSEVREIVDYLNSHNILIETGGFSVELLTDVNFGEGWIAAMKYIDESISLTIATESLSFQESQFGARAQAIVHDRAGTRTAIADALIRDSWINEGLIDKILRVNFGTDIDPSDKPKFRSRVRRETTIEQVKAFVDMGGEADADRVAVEFGVPIADEDTERVLKAVVKTTGPGQETDEDGEDAIERGEEESRERD